MASINYGKPRKTLSVDSLAKLGESVEAGDNLSLSGEEQILRLGYDVDGGEEARETSFL